MERHCVFLYRKKTVRIQNSTPHDWSDGLTLKKTNV